MRLELVSEPRKLPHVHFVDRVVVHEDHAVRISHRDSGDRFAPAGNLERIVDDPAVGGDRNFATLQNRLAHIHGRTCDVANLKSQLDRL